MTPPFGCGRLALGRRDIRPVPVLDVFDFLFSPSAKPQGLQALHMISGQDKAPSNSAVAPKPSISSHLPDVEGKHLSFSSTFWVHLRGEIRTKKATGPLAAYCFMTGFL